MSSILGQEGGMRGHWVIFKGGSENISPLRIRDVGDDPLRDQDAGRVPIQGGPPDYWEANL